MDSLLFYAVIVGVFLALRTWINKRDVVWNTLPGPSYKWPLIGNMPDVRNSFNVSEFTTMCAKKYGPIFRFYMFGKSRVMVTDPAVVKHVLLNNHLFDKNMFQYHLMAKALGYGLVTQPDESVHKYHRSIVSPAFAHKHLRGLVPIFQRKGAILVEDWCKIAGTGAEVLIKEDIAKATSDVIGEAAFGYQLNAQRNDSSSSIFHIMANVLGGGLNFFEGIPILRDLLPSYKTRLQYIAALDKKVQIIMDKKIEKREQEQKLQSTANDDEENPRERDLLDILLDCQNEDGAILTRTELADQTKTFLLAGYETSSVCVFWTMHALAKNPEIQKKLADEVISIIGRDKVPSAEDIDKMPYLYKVLRESLRFYPPIPFVVRQATQDVTLGGYTITKGTPILINIIHQHHHSPVWDKPEVFDPERWSVEESDTNNLLGSYIPFIMGARNCIGSRFAMLEVRVLLAMIVQKLKFEEPANQKPPGSKARISMTARNPVHMIFNLRE